VLWLVVLMPVVLRVAVALYLGDVVEMLLGTHDQLSHDALFQKVAAGKGFVFDGYWYSFTPPDTPTAHWPFLCVLFLEAVYSLVRHPL